MKYTNGIELKEKDLIPGKWYTSPGWNSDGCGSIACFVEMRYGAFGYKGHAYIGKEEAGTGKDSTWYVCNSYYEVPLEMLHHWLPSGHPELMLQGLLKKGGKETYEIY